MTGKRHIFFSFHFPNNGKPINFSLFTSQETGNHIEFLFSLPKKRENFVFFSFHFPKNGKSNFFLFSLPAERENISFFTFLFPKCQNQFPLDTDLFPFTISYSPEAGMLASSVCILVVIGMKLECSGGEKILICQCVKSPNWPHLTNCETARLKNEEGSLWSRFSGIETLISLRQHTAHLAAQLS